MSPPSRKSSAARKSIYPVLAGDGFRVVVEAIGGANSVEPEDLRIPGNDRSRIFPGLTGTISFNDKGDRIGEVYRVYRVDNQGAFVLQP